MTETTATRTLIDAWHNRRLRAVKTLGIALEAPALSKPETVAELDREVSRATQQARFWMGQEAGR